MPVSQIGCLHSAGMSSTCDTCLKLGGGYPFDKSITGYCLLERLRVANA